MKINKKLLVNLGCLLTGGYFGWVITDIFHMNKECKMIEEHTAEIKKLSADYDEAIKQTKSMKERIDEDVKITECICKEHGMTDEDFERIKRDIHFTE